MKSKPKAFSKEDYQQRLLGMRHSAYSTTMFEHWPTYAKPKRQRKPEAERQGKGGSK